MYKAVFFDLDGTLLPIDTGSFMRRYFHALADYMEAGGCDVERSMGAIRIGTDAMLSPDGKTTNEHRFWDAFLASVDPAERDWNAFLSRFYEVVFPQLKAGIEPDPLAGRVVECLAGKGYRLILTTNPLFPIEATLCRLSWTGANPSLFERVTAYHNSRFAKPEVDYYRENLAVAGLEGAEVLMVGNDPVEDGAARTCGCDLYLVTDHLVERPEGAGAPLAGTPHGTMGELLGFAESLPALATLREEGAR